MSFQESLMKHMSRQLLRDLALDAQRSLTAKFLACLTGDVAFYLLGAGWFPTLKHSLSCEDQGHVRDWSSSRAEHLLGDQAVASMVHEVTSCLWLTYLKC